MTKFTYSKHLLKTNILFIIEQKDWISTNYYNNFAEDRG